MEATSATQETHAVPVHAYPALDERIDEELSRFDLEKTPIPLGTRYSFLSIICVDWIMVDHSRVATLTIAGRTPTYEYRFLNNGSSTVSVRLDSDHEPVTTSFEKWNQAITDICKTIILQTQELANQANFIATQANNQAWRYNFPS